ncbi:hypothetical protein WDU94_005589 [Cyamophila willieti]
MRTRGVRNQHCLLTATLPATAVLRTTAEYCFEKDFGSGRIFCLCWNDNISLHCPTPVLRGEVVTWPLLDLTISPVGVLPCSPLAGGFLLLVSNPKNKHQLITLLMSRMQEKGIFTHQSESDADLLIVKTAIDKSALNPVALVGDDVDIAVLLMACTPSTRDVFMIKPGRGKAKMATFSSQEM